MKFFVDHYITTVSRSLFSHMIESHAPVDTMERSQDVAHDIDGSHGRVGGEPRYRPIVVKQVAQYRVGQGAGGTQEEDAGCCVVDHLLRTVE